LPHDRIIAEEILRGPDHMAMRRMGRNAITGGRAAQCRNQLVPNEFRADYERVNDL